MRLKFHFVYVTVSLFFLGLVFAADAFAYLDPGTGSMIFQAVIAVFLAVAATGKLWWSKIKSLFQKRPPENEENE